MSETAENTVRLGIIGMGNMGSAHAKSIINGKVPGITLTAVADKNQIRLEAWADCRRFSSGAELIESGVVDAVLIATPHYSHTTLGVAALKAGLHTLVEKPISVHKADCERLISAWTDQAVVFAAMFNQRTNPAYQKLKSLIDRGELGRIERVNWIVTDWYRTEHYYRSGGWRASWGGEGGGVLLNQCPHNLDLIQWLFGMPGKVTAVCQFGRFHTIEVEDAVSAILEFPNGATGVFVTTTGESPGTNRLEVIGDRGKVMVEDNAFRFIRTEITVSEHRETSPSSFGRPDVWNIDIPLPPAPASQHVEILKNFSAAILRGEPLLAPAAEGIHSVELANAMLYSSFTGSTVEIPMSGDGYEAVLKKKIEDSTFQKDPPSPSGGTENLAGSF